MNVSMVNTTGAQSIIPGYKNKGYEEATAEVKRLNEEHMALFEEWGELMHTETKSSEMLTRIAEINDKMGVIEETVKDLEIQIENGVYYRASNYNEEPYTESEVGFSLGDLNGRTFIGRNCDRLPLDKYEEVCIASEFDPENDNETNIEDLLTMFNVTEDDSIMFDSNIVYGPALKSDDPKTISKAIAHGHRVMMINAENKKACEVLRSSKEPVYIGTKNLTEIINNSLCAKAKSKAVILVNHSAFAKIDVTDGVGGYAIIKRDGEGRFIYRDKYPVQEIADEILPNNEDGSSPVIIGDLSILRFLIMRDDACERDSFLELKVNDRNLKREIIALTTTSDSAYIHGYI